MTGPNDYSDLSQPDEEEVVSLQPTTLQSTRPQNGAKKTRKKNGNGASSNGSSSSSYLPPHSQRTESPRSARDKRLDLVVIYLFISIMSALAIFGLSRGNLALNVTPTSSVAILLLSVGIVYVVYQRQFHRRTSNGIWATFLNPDNSIQSVLKKMGIKGDPWRFEHEGQTYIILPEYVRYYNYTKMVGLFRSRVPALTYFRDDPWPSWWFRKDSPLVSGTELLDILDERAAHNLARATGELVESESGRFSTRKVMMAGFAGTILLLVANLYFSQQIKTATDQIIQLASG